jgi:MraZ protein
MSKPLGEFDVTFDAKGRFIIPAGLKRQLAEGEGNEYILSRGFDQCLTIYTPDQWKKMETIVERINEFNEKARAFKRNFLNGATRIYPDASGRLLIPTKMLEYANIKKDAVFSAQVNKMELWDAASFKGSTELNQEDMSDLAQEVMGNDFLNPLIV